MYQIFWHEKKCDRINHLYEWFTLLKVSLNLIKVLISQTMFIFVRFRTLGVHPKYKNCLVVHERCFFTEIRRPGKMFNNR